MTYQALAERARASMLPGAAAALAVAIFVADALTPPDCVVGGLYVIVVLIAGQFCGARALWLVAAACAALTVLAQCLAHRLVAGNDAAAYIGAFNTSVSIVAIVMSTYLIRRGQSAEAALQGAQTDLARVSRVTTLGELTASIAHEVNQPIAAAVTNASACLRWLAGEPPDLEQARAAAARIVRDGSRAAEIVSRIRVMFAKGEGDRGPVELNQLARETLDLLGSEAARHAVAVRTDLMRGLPVVRADRVQVQQVLVNLVLNAFDAMKDIDGPRDLTVRSRRTRATRSRCRWQIPASDCPRSLRCGFSRAFRHHEGAGHRHGALDQPLDDRVAPGPAGSRIRRRGRLRLRPGRSRARRPLRRSRLGSGRGARRRPAAP